MTFIFNSYKPMTLARVAVEGLSVHQSLYSSIRPSVRPPVRASVYSSVRPSNSLFIRLSVLCALSILAKRSSYRCNHATKKKLDLIQHV